jgi:transcriptional regulator with XRE-family HTH domain
MDHFSTIGNIERGTANPTFLTLLRVADALEISLGKLTGRSDRIQRQMRKTRKSAKRK